MSIETLKHLKKILKGVSTLQGVVFNHHTRHEKGGGDEVNIVGVPSGVICMWSGTLATIPSGWALCDGSNGTPDLRDKFIYGCSAGEDPGASGGAATHTHTYSDIPSHSHGVGTLGADSGGAHTHGSGSLGTGGGGGHSHSINDPGHHHNVGCQRVAVEGDYIYCVSSTPTAYLDTNTVGTGISVNGVGNHTHSISGSTAEGGSHTHSISGSTAATGVASPETDAGSSLPSYFKLAFIQKT